MYPMHRGFSYPIPGQTRNLYPTVNPLTETLRVDQPDGSISISYQNGTIEKRYSNGISHFHFPWGARQTAYANGKVETRFPDGMNQEVFPNGDVVYDMDRTDYKVKYRYDQPTDSLTKSLVDKNPNPAESILKVFYSDGSVNKFRAGDRIKHIEPDPNIERDLLADGTETKKYRNENILISKNKNYKEKIADYVTNAGERIPILQKLLDTGEMKVSQNVRMPFYKLAEAIHSAYTSYLAQPNE